MRFENGGPGAEAEPPLSLVTPASRLGCVR